MRAERSVCMTIRNRVRETERGRGSAFHTERLREIRRAWIRPARRRAVPLEFARAKRRAAQ